MLETTPGTLMCLDSTRISYMIRLIISLLAGFPTYHTVQRFLYETPKSYLLIEYNLCQGNWKVKAAKIFHAQGTPVAFHFCAGKK